MKKAVFNSIIFLVFVCRAQAQTIYVSAVAGKEEAAGTIDAPFASLEEAVRIANSFDGSSPIKTSPVITPSKLS